MTKIALTGADFADLAAGDSFNTLCEDGEEIILDGDDFTDADITTLATGGEVEYEDRDGSYTITAPEAPWTGHRT
jgi:hypothetical protein